MAETNPNQLIGDLPGENPASSRLAEAAARRAAQLLRLPNPIDEIGLACGGVSEDLNQLRIVRERMQRLSDISRRLETMMTVLQPPRSSGLNWLSWLRRERQSYDAMLPGLCKKIAAMAEQGQQTYVQLRSQNEAMASRHKLLNSEIVLLKSEIEAGWLLASPAYATALKAAGLSQQHQVRLLQRLTELDDMSGTMALCLDQIAETLQEAHSVISRYRTTRKALVPIWKKTVGFDLFVRRQDAPGALEPAKKPEA